MAWQTVGLLVFAGVYGLGVLWLWRGLGRAPARRVADRPEVSVIVAARNEEAHLPDCIAALKAQDYSAPFEVVIVDDRSHDATWDIVAAESATWSALRGIKAGPPKFACPKKSALAQGIAASSGENLLFTDADCRPPADWIRSMVAHFAPGVGLVAGYARPDPVTGVVAGALAVDNLAVGALAAGSFAQGRPLSCTGRSLGYRRAVYDELDGFERIGHLIGGDDVYFMRLVAAQDTWTVAFNRDAVVLSQPPPKGWGAIVQQKLRHAAKGGHYRGGAYVLALAMYAFHLFLAWGLGAMMWQGHMDFAVLGVWAARWGVDLMMLWRMASKVERPLLRYMPLVEVLYIPYVLIFTVVGRLGWFRWKS